MRYTTEQLKQIFAGHHGSRAIKRLISNAKRIGHQEAVEIGEQRLQQLFQDEQSGQSPVYNALMKQVHAYEAVLSNEADRKRVATYSRRKIATVGAVQMLKDLLAKTPDTLGLNKLRETGNLHAAYEQVVVDHPTYFTLKEVVEAKRRLGLG